MEIFDEIAERKIKEAIDKNEFKDLEGFGRPLDNKEYFSVPEENRIAFHILKNANIVPEEIDLKKQIININSLIQEELSTGKRDELLLERSKLLTKLDILLENYRSR